MTYYIISCTNLSSVCSTKRYIMLFSIITVVYNAKMNLMKTIESVFSQENEHFQYIIIDGGSNDGTVEFLKTLVDNRREIIIRSEPDKGIYDAMNKGVKLATGQYSYFLNAGDRFANTNVLSDTEKIIEQTDADIFYGDAFDWYRDDKVILHKYNNKINKLYFLRGNGICHQAVFAKTELLVNMPFLQKYRLAADKDWIMKQYVHGKKFCYLGYPICYYDRGGISSDPKQSDRLKKETKDIIISNYRYSGPLFYKCKELKQKFMYLSNTAHSRLRQSK